MKVLITVISRDTPITLNGVKIWLPILITVCGIVFSYAVATSRVSALGDRVTSVELRQTKYDENYYQLKDSVTEIKTILNERLPAKKY